MAPLHAAAAASQARLARAFLLQAYAICRAEHSQDFSNREQRTCTRGACMQRGALCSSKGGAYVCPLAVCRDLARQAALLRVQICAQPLLINTSTSQQA